MVSQILLRILKVVLVLAAIYFILWALNQFGVVDLKLVFLQAASKLPGLSDVAESYELGRKRSELLAEREKALALREKELAKEKLKLAEDRNLLNRDKYNWQIEHPPGQKTVKITANSNKLVPGQFGQPRTPEMKIKEYLAMVGKMKPKQAASVIQKLPEETVFAIFDQIRPDQVTKIMENLPEDYLAKLTQDRLTKYRDL